MTVPHFFIAGTDTGVGKTYITGLIAANLKKCMINCVTQKWVQTGNHSFSEDLDAHLTAMGLVRDDFNTHLNDMNPYCFSLPASPHFAAQQAQASIDPQKIISSFHKLTESFDTVIVEGAGGLLVPYSNSHTMLDIVSELTLPVLLVVENKLGCINHCLLSLETLQHRQIPCLGIILNDGPTPCGSANAMLIRKNNFDTLTGHSNYPVFDTFSIEDFIKTLNVTNEV